MRLGEALRRVNCILAGEDVAARLPFADQAAAERALGELGARVVEPETAPSLPTR